MFRHIFVVLAVAGLAACSSGEHVAVAEQGISDFRRHMDTEQFAQVYAQGSDELRNSTSEADLTKILAALKTKLGKVKSAEKDGWNVNFHTSGTFVTLSLKTQFEKGAGTESFVFAYRMAGRPS